MNVNKALVMIAVLLGMYFPRAAFAANFTWVGGEESSWQDPASYQEPGKPSEGDTVVIGDMNASSHPDWTATVNDADIDFVSKLSSVKLGINSTVIFDISGENSVACPVTSQRGSGRSDFVSLVKKGSGTLTLGATGAMDYYVSIDVQEGVLRCGESARTVIDLNVADGAQLVLPNGEGVTVSGRWFTGQGLVTNETDAVAKKITLNEIGGTFEGVIGGNISFQVGGSSSHGPYCSDVQLLGVNSTYFGQNKICNSTLGVRKFGKKGEKSSIGSHDEIKIEGSGVGSSLLCLGEELQTTDKSVQFDFSGVPFTFDAGVFGGVTFTGTWWFSGSNRRQHVLCLSGSNTVNEAVFAGSFNEPYYRDDDKKYWYNYSTYLCKKGPGIWRLANASGRGLRGTVAVEEGTLRFDSVAEAGVACSLGYSTLPTAGNAADTAAEAGIVPYAVVIGGETTEGIFEYTGTSDAACSTRPIAVKGPARLRNATDRDFAWENVFGLGEDAKTLTLDGDSTTAVNSLTTVTNGCGKLSLVKDGAGIWTLDKAIPNGTVAVHAGTLVFHRQGLVPTKDLDPSEAQPGTTFAPTWYRLTIMQNYQNWLEVNVDPKVRSPGDSRTVLLGEFALYDKDGKRLNKGLTYVYDEGKTTCSPITKLQPGNVAIEYGSWATDRTGRDPNRLTDGTTRNTGLQTLPDASAGLGSSDYMSVGLPKSWQKFVMRLPEGSPAAAAYDYANDDCKTYSLGSRERQLYAYSIECSLDGVNWFGLTNVIGAAENETEGRWVSDNTVVSHDDRPGCGYVIDSRISTRPGQSSFDLVESVSVDQGATLAADCEDGVKLTIKGLTINPNAGAGTIDGFQFASTGTMNLTELPANGSKVKFTLLNCVDFANVGNWSVRLNGQTTDRYDFSVGADGEVTFHRKGFVIFFR